MALMETKNSKSLDLKEADAKAGALAPSLTGDTNAKAKPGKLKETLSVASTALPVAGAIGTLAVWLAANFYVGEIQITPDRPFNTLEVRVSDKKGQESVFHSPHFQLMPGRYHLEVTVDSQYKQHADIKSVFRHNTAVPIHIAGAPVAATAVPVPEATPTNVTPVGSPIAPAATSSQAPTTLAPTKHGEQKSTQKTDIYGDTGDANSASGLGEEKSAESSDSTSTKKRWWQVWKKSH